MSSNSSVDKRETKSNVSDLMVRECGRVLMKMM